MSSNTFDSLQTAINQEKKAVGTLPVQVIEDFKEEIDIYRNSEAITEEQKRRLLTLLS